MASAMRAFEAFKEKSGGFNMFACRSIIDVCGLCGDFLKSRSIFKVTFWMPFARKLYNDFLSYYIILCVFVGENRCVFVGMKWFHRRNG